MPKFDEQPNKWTDTVPDLAPIRPAAPKPEKKGKPEEPPPPSLSVRLAGALFMTLLLAGGVWVYFTLATQSELKETLPMPKALRTTSAAHGDLVRLIREFDELAVDVTRSLRGVGRTFVPAAERAMSRLDRLKKTVRALEPQLTRDESRSLIALENGAKFLKQFIGSTAAGGSDHRLETVDLARAQFRRALDLAKGKPIDELFVAKLKGAAAGKSGGAGRDAMDELEDVRAAGGNLRLGQ